MNPQTRNWNAYIVAGAVASAVMGGIVWWGVSGEGRAVKEEEAPQHSRAGTNERWPERDFQPTPPPPPPQPIYVERPVEPPPPPPPAVAAPVVPPKPKKYVTNIEIDVDGRDEGFGAAPPSSSSGAAGPEPAQHGTSGASQFLSRANKTGGVIVNSPYLPPLGRHILQAGTMIPAQTTNMVNSDLPGDVFAQITENVCDSVTGRTLLIPATAVLQGVYSSDEIQYGQRRALVAWTRILFPNGYSQEIGSMVGTDQEGAAGIEGEVDRHPWSMAGAIGLSAFMSVLGQAGTLFGGGGGGQTNIGIIGMDGAAREGQSIGREFVQRELNRKNTLILPAGTPVAVTLNKDVVTLAPYPADGTVACQ